MFILHHFFYSYLFLSIPLFPPSFSFDYWCLPSVLSLSSPFLPLLYCLLFRFSFPFMSLSDSFSFPLRVTFLLSPFSFSYFTVFKLSNPSTRIVQSQCPWTLILEFGEQLDITPLHYFPPLLRTPTYYSTVHKLLTWRDVSKYPPLTPNIWSQCQP
jgi:hypothetical protein